MKKFCFCLAALLFSMTAPSISAWAQCQPGGIQMDISVTPPQPSHRDSVTIEVSGYFPDGCWGIARLDSSMVSGNTIYLFSYAPDCWQQPCLACPLVVIPIYLKIKTGPLPAGNYSIISSMQTNSLRMQPGLCTANFTVQAESVTSSTSYGLGTLFVLLAGTAAWMFRKKMAV